MILPSTNIMLDLEIVILTTSKVATILIALKMHPPIQLILAMICA
jgi:hypothetical protein